MPVGPRKYCLSCGEEVDTHIAERDGNMETRCLFCGLVIESCKAGVEDEDIPHIDAVPIDEDVHASAIAIADDSDFLREFMRKIILKRGLAKEVIACVDGQDFVAQITRALAQDMKVDLVILDLEMPRMDGITAARTLRVVEKKFGLPSKIPILFFSVHRCDESMKKQLSQAAPASYINKGMDSSPEKLTTRVEQLVHHLLAKKNLGVCAQKEG